MRQGFTGSLFEVFNGLRRANSSPKVSCGRPSSGAQKIGWIGRRESVTLAATRLSSALDFKGESARAVRQFYLFWPEFLSELALLDF